MFKKFMSNKVAVRFAIGVLFVVVAYLLVVTNVLGTLGFYMLGAASPAALKCLGAGADLLK